MIVWAEGDVHINVDILVTVGVGGNGLVNVHGFFYEGKE